MVRHPNVGKRWEPRENRGRLRHCEGLQTPNATVSAGAGPGRRERGSKPQSQDISLPSLVRSNPFDHFSDKEKDEASPLNESFNGSTNGAFILPCRSLKVFFVSAPQDSALVSQSQPVPEMEPTKDQSCIRNSSFSWLPPASPFCRHCARARSRRLLSITILAPASRPATPILRPCSAPRPRPIPRATPSLPSRRPI